MFCIFVSHNNLLETGVEFWVDESFLMTFHAHFRWLCPLLMFIWGIHQCFKVFSYLEDGIFIYSRLGTSKSSRLPLEEIKSFKGFVSWIMYALYFEEKFCFSVHLLICVPYFDVNASPVIIHFILDCQFVNKRKNRTWLPFMASYRLIFFVEIFTSNWHENELIITSSTRFSKQTSKGLLFQC